MGMCVIHIISILTSFCTRMTNSLTSNVTAIHNDSVAASAESSFPQGNTVLLWFEDEHVRAEKISFDWNCMSIHLWLGGFPRLLLLCRLWGIWSLSQLTLCSKQSTLDRLGIHERANAAHTHIFLQHLRDTSISFNLSPICWSCRLKFYRKPLFKNISRAKLWNIVSQVKLSIINHFYLPLKQCLMLSHWFAKLLITHNTILE